MRMPRYHFNTQFLRMGAFQWKRLSGNCRHGKAAGARRTGSDKVLYHEADHLGSVHVVKDGGSNVRQRFDYYPFGKVSQDPLSEKYYSISPYAYCSNDPLNRFDLDGYADF